MASVNSAAKVALDLSRNTYLITGATSGLGKATAVSLAKNGANLVVSCRNPSLGKTLMDTLKNINPASRVSMYDLNLTDMLSVERFAASVRSNHPRLDGVVLNAGIMSFKSFTADGVEENFLTNHIGHFHLTNQLNDVILRSERCRLVVVTSRIHMRVEKWEIPSAKFNKDPLHGYAFSKLANILFVKQLSTRLPVGITVNGITPGMVQTDIGLSHLPRLLVRILRFVRRFTNPNLQSPEVASNCIVHLLTDPSLENITGMYFEKFKMASPSTEADNPTAAKELWDYSEVVVTELLRAQKDRAGI